MNEPLVRRDHPAKASLSDYDRLMCRFESVAEGMILPEMHVIVRIDAHRLREYWRDYPEPEYPFGEKFVDALHATAVVMMRDHIRARCCYVHGDEISFYLPPSEISNERRRSRLCSGIASLAAVTLIQHFERPVIFHAVICEVPSIQRVIDYFCWQRLVASRNFRQQVSKRNISSSEAVRGESLNPDQTTANDTFTAVSHAAKSLPSRITSGTLWWWHTDGNLGPVIGECSELPADPSQYNLALKRIFDHEDVKLGTGTSSNIVIQNLTSTVHLETSVSDRKSQPISAGVKSPRRKLRFM